MGMVEGISIILAACFIMLITTLTDWVKDKKFVSLQKYIKNEQVPVIRGKFGAT
jgi:hypothetical protein